MRDILKIVTLFRTNKRMHTLVASRRGAHKRHQLGTAGGDRATEEKQAEVNVCESEKREREREKSKRKCKHKVSREREKRRKKGESRTMCNFHFLTHIMKS